MLVMHELLFQLYLIHCRSGKYRVQISSYQQAKEFDFLHQGDLILSFIYLMLKLIADYLIDTFPFTDGEGEALQSELVYVLHATLQKPQLALLQEWVACTASLYIS